MIVKRFYDSKLAQTSYLIGCGRTGNAVVIDANRDIEQYIRTADAEGVRITHVTETHIHADFVSGSRELAASTDAALYLSDEGGEGWQYTWASDAGATLLHDGDSFSVGNVVVEAVHTPGHTPEHVSFLITDTAAADAPIAMVTGDFVFVGDVGRPDLLERAAQVHGTMEASARALYHSLQKFAEREDWLQIWPGHGAGSACGKGLSAVPHSTVGYERRFNWAFTVADEDEFVSMVLAGQPEPPRYFAEMKRINRDGPRVLDGFPEPVRCADDELQPLLQSGAIVVDTRSAAEFAAGHVHGTLNIPLDNSFTTWAGWLLPYDTDFHLIVDSQVPGRVQTAVRDLAMIGLDRVAGVFQASAVTGGALSAGAERAGGEGAEHSRGAERVEQITPQELAERMQREQFTIVDVRGASEWKEGHVPGAINIPVGYLAERIGSIPRDMPIVLHCQSGARSAIASSVMLREGVPVLNLVGGMSAWRQAALPVEQ